MRLLDKVSFSIIVPLALLLALAPFVPEPHLWQKLKMLFTGTLARPVDIFDLIMHATPLVIVILKLASMMRKK